MTTPTLLLLNRHFSLVICVFFRQRNPFEFCQGQARRPTPSRAYIEDAIMAYDQLPKVSQ